ncbi:MAG: glutamate racemase [Solirubrobacteraceae bacterium]
MPPVRDLPIAVFDSGVGGLTVLHECLVSLPHEDFLYLGDTLRFPYGDCSAEELREYSLELGAMLVDEGAKLLVVACNSATSAALPALQEALRDRVRVIGVVEPDARLAAALTPSGRVGLLATPATVASGAYDRALAEAGPGSSLTSVACRRLAPLIQAGGEVDEATVTCVDEACTPLKEADVDTVILGCTHYPLIRHVMRRALGRGVELVSSGEAIAAEVERGLVEDGLEADPGRKGMYHFLSSGDPAEFRRVGTRFLQLPIARVRQVRVGADAARATA